MKSEYNQITETLYKVALAFDTNNESLLRSVLSKEITLQIGEMTMAGIEEVISGSFAHISTLETHHIISNVIVDFISGSQATGCAVALAQHQRPGNSFGRLENGYLVASRYRLEFRKENGIWRVFHWDLKPTWGTGDSSIMVPK